MNKPDSKPKTEAKVEVVPLQSFFFPGSGLVIAAENIEEATKKHEELTKKQ